MQPTILAIKKIPNSNQVERISQSRATNRVKVRKIVT